MQQIKLKSIKGFKAFNAVFDSGKKFKTSDVLGVFCDKSSSAVNRYESGNAIYYGVTVSKRIAPKAVMRNRIKRLLREALRQTFKSINYDSFNYDIILISWRFVPKHPKQLRLDYVLKQVAQLIDKANKYNSPEEKNASNSTSNS